MRRRSRTRARQAQTPISPNRLPQLTPEGVLAAVMRAGGTLRTVRATRRPVSDSSTPPRSSSRDSRSSAVSAGSSLSRPRTRTQQADNRRPSLSPGPRSRRPNTSVGGANTLARALARSAASSGRAPVPGTSQSSRRASPRRGGRSSRPTSRPASRPSSRGSSSHSVSEARGASRGRTGTARSRRRATTATSRHSVLSSGTETRPGSRAKTPKRKSRSKSRVSFVLPESSARIVMTSDKYLSKILCYLNWNELNAARVVSKQWMKLVATDPGLQAIRGVITIGRNVEEAFKVLNKSLTTWTQFRINVNTVFDLNQPAQSEFWYKHGASMQYLEIRNSAMTLSCLVEVLSRTPNLVHFLIRWTVEMYSFNSEFIRKYYGVHFRNGQFSKMESLTIEKNSFLSDTALWSLLKWCGGCLHSLTLSSGPEETIDDHLSRLKPRWTMDPIENFANRFGYSGNFKFLDFSGSNLTAVDLVRLSEVEKLTHLTSIRLSHCKINDEATIGFLLKKGGKLEELYLDYTPITDSVFNFRDKKDLKLGKLRVLSISGTQNFRNFNFLPDLCSLDSFYCSGTQWLTTNMITKPLEQHQMQKPMKRLDLSSNEKMSTKNVDLNLCHIWFIHFSTILSKITELNLNQWTQFGTDTNFKSICNNMPLLRKLRLQEWKELSDEGVTGITYQELAEFEELRKDIWRSVDAHIKTKPLIGKLKHLEILDLARCVNLTDMSIQFGILFLPNLRALNLGGSQVSDAGIHVLIAKSRTIDKLSLVGCERITPKGRRVHRLDGRSVYFGLV